MHIKPILILISFSALFGCEKMDDGLDPSIKTYSLSIEYSGDITADKKTAMTLQEFYAGQTHQYAGTVKTRGGFSIGFPKPSFEINLENDVSLAGLPADDDWILNANYIDKTFLRHVLSYRLFRDMQPNNRAARCSYLDLELNVVYSGLYVLMEKVDRSVLEVDKNDPAAVIFKEPHIFRPDYAQIPAFDPDNFHQQTFPDIEDADKTAFAETVRDFILQSSDSDFSAKIDSVFDIQNVIDWHLLLLVSNNSDGLLKNFYLYKTDSETPLRIAPWDYDHSFGRDGDNELNLDRFIDMERSILFARLLTVDWYNQALKDRWKALNNGGLFSLSGLKNRVEQTKIEVENRVTKNAALWPLNGPWYYDANDFEAEIQIMLDFMALRHVQLEAYFK